ncbi:glycoside hydrolase family 127 protein [Pedobacter sp. ok626]|uniref:glycoside hydrolase family 127 protein n=1 Tax=Pedobacter sp. ok626 TaxID=1761882 RepID=UPI001404658E|nr:beta-L-arabinofuranosidase domain-containing protein [Pedobacter sp. ok626]
MKFFLFTCIFFLFLLPAHSNDSLWISGATKFRPLVLGDEKIKGYVGEKIDACIANSIKTMDVSILVAPFKTRIETRYWQSEFWGKWFTAACDAYRYTNDPLILAKLKQAVEGLMATQTKDGYIGNYKQEARLKEWDIWGRKYCLLGLLSYYEISKDKKVLGSAKMLADHLIKEIADRNISKFGNFRGMAASSVLEPIVLLYNYTKDARYLKFAEAIVAGWEQADGAKLISKSINGTHVAERFPKPKNWFSPENGQKAYEMMSCYEGLIELYKVTKKEEYKAAVEKAVKDIIDTEIMITGSGSSLECWYGGKDKQCIPAKNMMETCVTATWIKLCNRMLQLTGKPEYADEIEKAFYNALLGSMTPDGKSWSKYSELNGHRHLGEMQCGMPLNCCIASGPRGMMVIPKMAIMMDKYGPVVNLFGNIKAKIKLENLDVSITQESFFPKSNEVVIYVDPSKKAVFNLKIRIPAWSDQTSITVNGDILNSIKPGSYLEIKRKWSKGDKVVVKLDLKGKILTDENKRHFAIQYGPLILAADQRLNSGQNCQYYEPVMDKLQQINCRLVESADPDIYFLAKLPFRTGGQLTELNLTDYASSGNTWNRDSGYMVWFPYLLDPREK